MATKYCPSCDTTKDIKHFSKASSRKDGLQSTCKECQALRWQRYRKVNPKAATGRRRKQRDKVRSFMQEYKTDRGCSKCGFDSHPEALQFHHNDPNEKDITPARMVTYGWGLDKVKDEIEKCTVLCANCHAILHATLREKRCP